MEDKKDMTEVFAALKKEGLAPHPFLKTRILADVKERQDSTRKLRWWKMVSSLSMASLAVVLWTTLQSTPKTVVATERPYVIHVNLNENESQMIASAEIELPSGVSFYSQKNASLAELRRLKLPVHASDGRTKLPFVVVAKGSGEKKILVRLFDENNNLVKENFIKVQLKS